MDSLKKLFSYKKSEPTKQIERRVSPRYRLKKTALLCTDTGQSMCVMLEDIAAGGVRFRSDLVLRDQEDYVLKVRSAEDNFMFGLKLLWKKKDTTGNKTYGGIFVGPGSQNSPTFRDFLSAFDWKPVIRSPLPS